MTQLEDILKNTLSSPQKNQLHDKRKKSWRFLSTIAVVGLFFIALVLVFQGQIERLKKREKILRHSVNKLEYGVLSADCLGQIPIPPKFANIPFGEDSGLVINVKPISIRNVIAPHNPSLIASESGYDLFFRYDILSSQSRYASYFSQIGVVSLDKSFEQTDKELKKIDLPTDYTEDPRIVSVGDQLYLVFNMLDLENLKCRQMCVSNLQRDTFDVNYTTILDMNLKPVEKNWPPFQYIGAENEAELFFEYQISPRTLFSLPDPRKNELKPFIVPRQIAYLFLPWSEKWGEIRGGTPPQKIGDEYLGFFHSAVIEANGLAWYIMGAYTFQAKPPFALTGISKHPIFFHGIFDTPITNTASTNKRVCYPSGFVIEKQKDKELIHVACGENDSGIKIVTLDKTVLLKNMNRIEHK
jgi:predicted GH43/DUF377 family glycosyl hydrolase